MQRNITELPTPPLGTIDSLARGFETLVRYLPLLIPPLLLDVLLWLGPRLSIKGFVLPQIGAFFDDYMGGLLAGQTDSAQVSQSIDALRQTVEYQVAHFNAAGALMTAPLGIPSLTGLISPEAVPAAITPAVWELGNLWVTLLVVVGLASIGLLIGAFYLGMMAYRVRDDEMQIGVLLRTLPRYWLSLVALALIMLSTLLASALPIFFLASCLLSVSSLLGLVVLTMGLSVGMWTMVFLGFAVHSMLLMDRGLFPAIGDSIKVVRANAPSTIMFLMTVGLIYFGLSMVFRGEVFGGFLSPDSWLWFLSIVGHAFVSTGLFVATFVYYQDRFRHYQEFRAYLAHYQRTR